MTATITRPRRDHPEILDDPTLDPQLVERSMRDVVRSNTLLGGTRAVVHEIDGVLGELPRTATLLDVGTGMGDIPAAAQRSARRRGTALFTIGLDVSSNLTRVSRRHLNAAVCADGAALPFRAKSIDLVCCSQLIHHFESVAAARIIQEMDRVARHTVIVSDIRRSRVAAAGVWLASFALRFHPVSRHDGVASVQRGFDRGELRSLVLHATGIDPHVRRYAGFRVTARWRPTGFQFPVTGYQQPATGNQQLGSMPARRRMITIDEAWVGVAPRIMFELARDVERWPQLLPHYRYVRFRERGSDSGGLVEMSANRPFGAMRWPTWWLSLMNVDPSAPAIRFRHVEGITAGMDVEWQFFPEHGGTRVRIVHAWDGPSWPLIGSIAATRVIGPVFVHGIASRTLAGLATIAEGSTAKKE